MCGGTNPWCYFSYIDNITMSDILEHQELPWSWLNITNRETLRIKDVLNNPDKKWCFPEIVTHTFDVDRINYVKNEMKKILLTHILSKKYRKINNAK